MAIDNDDARPKRTADIDLTLRTPQVEYLEYLARWGDASLSHVFGSILERHVLTTNLVTVRVARLERKHFAINPDHAAALSRLTVQWGVSKSEAARRLIDMELAREREGLGQRCA